VTCVDNKAQLTSAKRTLRQLGETSELDNLVVVISYETLAHAAEDFAVSGKVVDLVIVDEAHNVNARTTQRAKAIVSVPARCRILLTATPMSNDSWEWYNLVNLASPGLLGDRDSFEEFFAIPLGKDRCLKAELALEELSDVRKDVYLARDEASLNLPTKTTYVLAVEFSARESSSESRAERNYKVASHSTSHSTRHNHRHNQSP
jgi:SNF2 family DNA or RNA helicase